MSQRAVQVETFIFDSPAQTGEISLKMAAKRYTIHDNCQQGLTLIFAHGSGFHKEHWEPIIEKLFTLQSSKAGSPQLREAWAFDWQSHGDSALLNESVRQGRAESVTIADWARAIVSVVTTLREKSHCIVAIGHSAGASVLMYSTKLFPRGEVPYSSIVLIEPPMIDRETFNEHLERQERALHMAKKAIASRRDNWPAKKDAYAWFCSHRPWSKWDKRILRLHCEFGLRPATQEGVLGVVTKCDKMEEVRNFEELEYTFKATEQIERVCHKVPIHVVFGEKIDLTPRYGQDSIVDKSKGRIVASITRVPGVGHWIVQERPETVALHIANVLDQLPNPSARL